MGPRTPLVAGELDQGAATGPGAVDRAGEQVAAEPRPAPVGPDPDGLDQCPFGPAAAEAGI